MNYTPEEIAEAERIVNDIAEHIDNRETRAALRQALSIYADKLDETRESKRAILTNAVLSELLTMREEADHEAIVAELNNRLIDRTQGLLAIASKHRRGRSATSFRAGWEAAMNHHSIPSAPGLEQALQQHLES